ncbi:DUF2189 domain-containing protein [Thiorhodovibrio frisius]|uniref:Putative integral membrane protein n=1 Tax=Thiorhodovibrio frisius TaxID=631362 RepID=H8Z4F7_9GAMM|nr:DUF2189 domain-containing protein [Thiorhodovibrio frisius]EIC20214.1 putative integral membrane protein [Thiorhodovibrio frisius]WPL20952.1 putative integral membrane protein [Thiorhodovibrio frisius]
MENPTIDQAPSIDRVAVPSATPDDGIRVNRITPAQPWEWLRKGWQDIQQARRYSLTYGAVVVLISALMTWALVSEGYVFIVPFLAAGFYLLAPVVGLGLYQISAHLERGEPLQFCNALEAWKRNQGQLSIITAGLILIMQFWMLANFVLFAMLYTNLQPPLESFFSVVFLSGENNAFVFASVLVGFVLAGLAYAISAISVPMLVDRKIDGLTAIRTSVKAVTTNWLPMGLWATIIVMVIGLGFVTFYVGLAIAMPLLGHATWHAYRDLVPRESDPV